MKNKKPFHERKFGKFLFGTFAGKAILETAQAIPWIGTAITGIKNAAEKKMISDKLVDMESLKGNDDARSIVHLKLVTNWKKYRMLLGAIMLWGLIQVYFPEFAGAIKEFVPMLLEGLK